MILNKFKKKLGTPTVLLTKMGHRDEIIFEVNFFTQGSEEKKSEQAAV